MATTRRWFLSESERETLSRALQIAGEHFDRLSRDTALADNHVGAVLCQQAREARDLRERIDAAEDVAVWE